MSFEERYELQVPLGETDHGTVWKGRDGKLKRDVAIAVLEDDAPEALRERFVALNEGAKSLRHAALARIYDVGENADGTPYAVMERVEGDSLMARLKEGPVLRLDQGVRAIVEVLGALGALHGAGLAHGDLEPGNILVRQRGASAVPKLVGLGLNRALVRSGAEPLAEESHLSSIAFCSPEQAAGETASAASDVYSASAILYAMVTGKLPHHGDSADAIRDDVKESAVYGVARYRNEVAGPLADAIDKALALDPADRFESAEALAKELRLAMLRTRGLGKMETLVSELSLEKGEEPPAAPEKMKPGRKAMVPKKPGGAIPKLGLKKPVLEKPAKKPPPPKPETPAKPEAPEETPAEENLEFERLSGLMEAPESVPPTDKTNEELEFERLSGLLEIPQDGRPPKRLMPKKAPPPPRKSAAVEDEEEEPEEEEETDEEAASAESQEGAEETEEEPADEEEAADEDAADEDAEAEEETAEADEETAEAAEEPAADETSDDADEAAVEVEVAEELAAEEPLEEEPKEEVPAAAQADAAETPDPFVADPFVAAPSDEDEIAEPAGAGGMPVWVWGLVAVAVIGVIGGLVAMMGGGEDDPPPIASDTQPTDVEEPVDPVADTEDPVDDGAEDPVEDTADEEPDAGEPDAGAPAAEATVAFVLTGVPEGATVWLGDEPVEGTTVEVTVGSAAQRVEVRLEGHRTWGQRISGDEEPQTFTVSLTPEAASTPPPTTTARPSGRRGATSSRRSGRAASSGRRGRASSGRRRGSSSRRSGRRGRSGRPAAVSDPGF